MTSSETNSPEVVFPRLKIPLDGDWKFREDSDSSGESLGWFGKSPWTDDARKCSISSPFQAQFTNLRDFHGFVWYQKEIHVPNASSGSCAILRFGAINYDPSIWINGVPITGDFGGGYRPVIAEIGELLEFGKSNTITVRVYFPHPRILPFYPHGKQKWYGHAGGIWQGGHLELLSKEHIEDCFVRSNSALTSAILTVKLSGNISGDYSLNTRVFSLERISEQESKSEQVAEKDVVIDRSRQKGKIKFTITLSGAKLWSPRDPHLYEARVRLSRGSNPVDEISVEFGIRKIKAVGHKLFLNNEPLLVRGALNQGFYPQTLYTPPGEEFIRHELDLAKEMGLNLLRLHVKIEDERYLKWADRLGILIWEDLPNVEIFNDDASNRLEKIFKSNLMRDRNHPSVIVWCIANEAWGPDPSNPDHARWLSKMYATGKVLSPDTLIIDNSPCYPNYHTSKTDIADFHFYAAIPAGSKLWMRFLDLLSSSPKKRNKLLFGPNRPNEGKPIVISEFGAWGLPTISQRGEKPWWFSQGWGPGVPSGMERRFENSGLSSVWKNLEDMERATQRHEFESLKFMIESMRKMPELSGYVITQFYDLHWEANGLLDSQRGRKEDFGDIQKLNADSVLIIDRTSTKTNHWSGEGFSVPVVFSNLSSRKMRNCILDWRFGKESGQVKIKLINSFGITAISKIRLKAPHVTTPTKLTLNLSMGSKDRIISASMDFLVSPKLKERHARSRLFFYDPGGHFDSLSTFRTLRKKIQFNSSPMETASDDERILISSTCDERVNHHLLIGGRALILADKIGTLKVGETAYTVETLEDNWIPGYNTILKKELFSQLPIETPMSWSYARVSPNLIIRNILPEDTEKIHVSYFQGWLHNFGATILKERTRRGGFAFVTTLNFEEYGKDPVATVLFENLLASLQGPQSN